MYIIKYNSPTDFSDNDVNRHGKVYPEIEFQGIVFQKTLVAILLKPSVIAPFIKSYLQAFLGLKIINQ
jgi:hypothetical protein